jgi:hypothetical protein
MTPGLSRNERMPIARPPEACDALGVTPFCEPILAYPRRDCSWDDRGGAGTCGSNIVDVVTGEDRDAAIDTAVAVRACIIAVGVVRISAADANPAFVTATTRASPPPFATTNPLAAPSPPVTPLTA